MNCTTIARTATSNSLDDFVAATSNPDGVEAGQILLVDEQNFIDLSRSCIFFSEERKIVED
jgi:hypothetical protein